MTTKLAQYLNYGQSKTAAPSFQTSSPSARPVNASFAPPSARPVNASFAPPPAPVMVPYIDPRGANVQVPPGATRSPPAQPSQLIQLAQAARQKAQAAQQAGTFKGRVGAYEFNDANARKFLQNNMNFARAAGGGDTLASLGIKAPVKAPVASAPRGRREVSSDFTPPTPTSLAATPNPQGPLPVAASPRMTRPTASIPMPQPAMAARAPVTPGGGAAASSPPVAARQPLRPSTPRG